jgi:hypothetical protein
MPHIPLYKLIDLKTNKPTEPKPRAQWKKPKPLKDRPLNQKQQNLVEVMLLNTMAKKPKTNIQMAREVGYTSSQSLKHPAVLEQMKPVLEQMKDLRQKALSAIADKNLNLVDYKELVDSTDKLTKNIQLLSGEATDNSKMTFSWLPQDAEEPPVYMTTINEHGNQDSLPTTQMGLEAPQLTTAVEGVRTASTRGENGSNTESSAA